MANEYPLSYVSNSLNSILSEMLTEYSDALEEKAQEVTKIVAEDFAQNLRQVTPRSNEAGEHLADSVTVTARDEKSYGKKHKVYRVHFKKWQISHLLEFGWTLRNGKKLVRKPFVRPLFDNNKDRYYRMYREELSK